jgi:hypothetical protein
MATMPSSRSTSDINAQSIPNSTYIDPTYLAFSFEYSTNWTITAHDSEQLVSNGSSNLAANSGKYILLSKGELKLQFHNRLDDAPGFSTDFGNCDTSDQYKLLKGKNYKTILPITK